MSGWILRWTRTRTKRAGRREDLNCVVNIVKLLLGKLEHLGKNLLSFRLTMRTLAHWGGNKPANLLCDFSCWSGHFKLTGSWTALALLSYCVTRSRQCIAPPPRQDCCLALHQAWQVYCEVVLFAQFPLGRASFNTQLFAEVWRLTNSGMWDHYCPHIDTYMYRVSSAEFLPHSIAHKLAGMSLVLVMSYVKICCQL